MINFGIDLGTTNSAIAKFDKGQVIVFRNPVGQKDTLPSVVAMRKGRLLVGDKAREWRHRAPDEVAAAFKRKMGTSEVYQVAGETMSPVTLSAHVLRELKQFIHTGEQPTAAVITIPASFDTVQANATRAAGHEAGFSQVQLLQEPIAASLAYANHDETDAFTEGKWLVYDLGGGTFDLALVQIRDGEMEVLDHAGDNFLGGTDFDQAIVERLLIPYLESVGTFTHLSREMKSASGRYNALYHSLLLRAEDAKIELTTQAETDIEFEVTDEAGTTHDLLYTLSRSAFEALIEPYFERTRQALEKLMARNQLQATDLNFVLLVGGSTYVPYIREQLAARTGLPVNTRVDPTTAVAVGAAFYAGTRPLQAQPAAVDNQVPATLQVRVAYQKATPETEEYFTATFGGQALDGLSYRVVRSDGGFDSGLQPLAPQIRMYLPLLKDSFNQFELTVYTKQMEPVPTGLPPIGITQGRYAVVGQPLPHDICLEVDDPEQGCTRLEVIFEKNTLLPARRTLVKQVSRTIAKGADEYLTISVIEGPGTALPASGQPIGFIRIHGADLERDLLRGSDVEITLDLSESRDLRINAYLLMTDQEYQDVFTPSARRVNIPRLAEELRQLAANIQEEVNDATAQENYEAARELLDLQYEILALADQAEALTEDDVTDAKFQLEDQKRRIAQQVDELTRDKHVNQAKSDYFQAKRQLERAFDGAPDLPDLKDRYAQLLSEEKSALATNSPLKIREYTEQVSHLAAQVRWQTPRYLREVFQLLASGAY
ncbi:MAG: Hsp70 family protein, partial [Bacteroidetes bacterium]